MVNFNRIIVFNLVYRKGSIETDYWGLAENAEKKYRMGKYRKESIEQKSKKVFLFFDVFLSLFSFSTFSTKPDY